MSPVYRLVVKNPNRMLPLPQQVALPVLKPLRVLYSWGVPDPGKAIARQVVPTDLRLGRWASFETLGKETVGRIDHRVEPGLFTKKGMGSVLENSQSRRDPQFPHPLAK